KENAEGHRPLRGDRGRETALGAVYDNREDSAGVQCTSTRKPRRRDRKRLASRIAHRECNRPRIRNRRTVSCAPLECECIAPLQPRAPGRGGGPVNLNRNVGLKRLVGLQEQTRFGGAASSRIEGHCNVYGLSGFHRNGRTPIYANLRLVVRVSPRAPAD